MNTTIPINKIPIKNVIKQNVTCYKTVQECYKSVPECHNNKLCMSHY